MRPAPLLIAAALLLTPAVRAAPSTDPVLLQGLRAFVANGPQACLAVWYPGQTELAAEAMSRITAATKNLGVAFDTEIVAIQPISRRVTRYYLAVYFNRRPLWIRIERYAGPDQARFLPLKLSLDPDDILPGYLTEFAQ